MLLTVGHSNHPPARFLGLLLRHGARLVIDVRSQPWSRRCPWFRRRELEALLAGEHIAYSWRGRELGARRDEPECHVDGSVDYGRIAALPVFREGLETVREAVAEGLRPALLCAEREPLDCHRTILVCRHLRDLETAHVLADGALELHEQFEERLLRRVKLPMRDLFGDADALLQEAYDRRGAQIAWSPS